MNLVTFGARIRLRGASSAFRRASLAWLLVLSAHATDAPLLLDAAIDRALQDAPQMSAAQAILESAQSLLPGAGRLPDPELILGVENVPATGPDQFSLTADGMTMAQVGLMQAFPAGAKRKYQSELASREADVAQAELHAARFEIASATAEAWIGAATAEQTLLRLRELRKDFGLQSTTSRAALSSGRSSVSDALAGETALARLDSEILDFEQQEAIQRAELARWIGDDSRRTLGEAPWKRQLDVAPEMLLENETARPAVAPLAARLEAARAEVNLAKAEKRPDWSAELMYGKRGPDFDDMVSLEFRVGLPFFTKNRQNPVIAAKLAAVRAGEAQQEAAIRRQRAGIESTGATWRAGRKRLEHFENTLLPLARDRSRAVLSAYGSGRGDMRAVLDALRDEIDLQREFVALEGDVTRAWTYLHLLHSPGATP